MSERSVQGWILNIGHGNIMMVDAAARDNRKHGISSEFDFINSPAIFLGFGHKMVRNSGELSNSYNKSDTALRTAISVPVGLWSGGEAVAKKPSVLWKGLFKRDEDRWVVSANDMALRSNSWLISRGAKKGFIAGDWFLKGSATAILQAQKDVTAFVFNQEALEDAQKNGIKSELIAPLLPFAYIDAQDIAPEPQESFLVKFSGSGYRPEVMERLRVALNQIGCPYAIETPWKTLTDKGVVTHTSVLERINAYQQQFKNVPKGFATPASEGVQIGAAMASFGMRTFILDGSGSHELRDEERAVKH